jgi:hypothetical protein
MVASEEIAAPGHMEFEMSLGKTGLITEVCQRSPELKRAKRDSAIQWDGIAIHRGARF